MTPAKTSETSFRRRAVLAAAAAVLGLASAGRAFAAQDLVDLTVVDRDTGQPIQVWRHHGRQFIAGEPGRRYSLRVVNHTGGRVMVVLSVDGVNVVTGETASWSQDGYVLHPYETYDVTGWRKTDSEVAAFAFAPLPQSYAARTGRPGDVGVVGMAVFTEKVMAPIPVVTYPQPRIRRPNAPPPPPPPPGMPPEPIPVPPPPTSAVREVVVTAARAPAHADAAGGLPAETRPEEKLGTAHGAREASFVVRVDFERASPHPQSVQRIEYDTWDNLAALGVLRRPLDRERPPRPFPSNPNGEGYVPDPPREP